ncbi:hypothetical protein KCU88_g7389, partial [Aureobasidium melanogenum]
MLSPLEIKYDLPCVEEAWLARSAHLWAMCQRRQYAENNGQVMIFESPTSQGFFYDASQTLLNSVDEMNPPPKLRLLKASPFSAIVLVMQLQVRAILVFHCEVPKADMKVTISQIMTRELVHASCLLDRSKATKRNCSLLSNTQCRQKLRAMKSIAEVCHYMTQTPTATVDIFPPSALLRLRYGFPMLTTGVAYRWCQAKHSNPPISHRKIP